jgi:hypothetical protein
MFLGSRIANDNKRTTTTMTFRIDKNVMRKLRVEAKYRDMSLNTLVNQIFKNFADWYMFESKVGMIPISKPVVIELFRNLNKDEIIDIATRVGKSAIFDIALFMKSKLDVDSFLTWLEVRMKSSSIEISHVTKSNNIHTYIIKHDICENWSLYQKTILELIFNEVLRKDVNINTSETTLTIRLEK